MVKFFERENERETDGDRDRSRDRQTERQRPRDGLEGRASGRMRGKLLALEVEICTSEGCSTLCDGDSIMKLYLWEKPVVLSTLHPWYLNNKANQNKIDPLSLRHLRDSHINIGVAIIQKKLDHSTVISFY